MAATGYTPIYIYYSSTATNAPAAGNLGYGELAINITDKNLFFKDNTNAVNTVPIRQASGSSNGWLSSTDWTTFNNKGSGTVTSVTGTSPVASSGGATPAISLASGYGDTQNPYASKTANYVLAAPNGSSGVPTFRALVAADVPTTFHADYLVIAGGGSGGSGTNLGFKGGGGGAGGYRTSVGTSGGNFPAEASLVVVTGVAYTVTVGAGGTGYQAGWDGYSGSNSVFNTITSTGGGGGGGAYNVGRDGGSGGGGSGWSYAGNDAKAGGSSGVIQGTSGGSGLGTAVGTLDGGGGGGGGGASASGSNAADYIGGNGGNGLANTITGTSVTRAGGGGGCGNNTAGTAGTGGATNGATTGASTNATANTGSGSGGSRGNNNSGNGGSGVVIIRIPSTRTATFSAGVTSSVSTTVPGYKVYTVTATSTTSETVTFS